MLIIFLFVHISLVASLTKWEKRTLQCDMDECTLSIRGEEYKSAQCNLDRDGVHECNIECPLADRDSVISKSPPNNRQCIRFHTYNTKQSAVGWSIWRSKECSKQKIILEVHCGFPIEN